MDNYNMDLQNVEEDEDTESTEKMVASNFGGKFEIILDVIKVNTNLSIGGLG